MSLIKCLLFASLLSQAASAAQGEAYCPGNVASLPLPFVQSSLIVISVEVNHSGPYDFVVDTGAQVNTIDLSLASELNLKSQGTVGVGGASTFSRSEAVYLDLVKVGDHSVSHSLAVMQDLAQLKAADQRIRGILGGSFLEHFDLLIDNDQRLMCLDDTGALASAIKGERIPLAGPHGEQNDLPFTRPIVVSARLSALESTPVLLRLDSGSEAPWLYAADAPLQLAATNPTKALQRTVDHVEQTLTVLPPQEVRIGKVALKQVSFVVPMQAVRQGPSPREDGLLPTMAYQRVFISSSRGFVTLEPRSWNRPCSSSMLCTMSLSQGTSADSRRSTSHAEPYGRRELQASQNR
jgi:hypothetical protein